MRRKPPFLCMTGGTGGKLKAPPPLPPSPVVHASARRLPRSPAASPARRARSLERGVNMLRTALVSGLNSLPTRPTRSTVTTRRRPRRRPLHRPPPPPAPAACTAAAAAAQALIRALACLPPCCCSAVWATPWRAVRRARPWCIATTSSSWSLTWPAPRVGAAAACCCCCWQGAMDGHGRSRAGF